MVYVDASLLGTLHIDWDAEKYNKLRPPGCGIIQLSEISEHTLSLPVNEDDFANIISID